MTTRERRLALLAGLAAAVGLLYLVVSKWIMPTWNDLQERIGRATDAIEQLDQKKAAVDKWEREYASRANLAIHTTSIEDAERIVYRRLNVLAKQATMSLPNLKSQTARRESHFEVVRFSFEIRCSLEQLMAFLRYFTEMEEAQRIDSLTIRWAQRMREPNDPLAVSMLISVPVILPDSGKAKKTGRA